MATTSPFITHFVQPKFTLARLTKEDEIFSLIVTLVKKIAPLVSDPNFPDLLEYIANLVENFVKDKDKINRNDLIIRIYKEIFPAITNDEIQHLLDTIQYLRNSNLIKRIPLYKKIGFYGYNFFFQS